MDTQPVNLKDMKSKITIIKSFKIKNNVALEVSVDQGIIYVGDYLPVKINGKLVVIPINVILLKSGQPVNLAYEGEVVIIPLSVKDIDIDTDSLDVYREYSADIANIGFLISVGINKLSESVISESFNNLELTKTMTTLLERNIFDELLSKGLKVVTAPAKTMGGFASRNLPKISIGLALAYLAKRLWDKYSDPCNRPFTRKEDKLRCLQQAADRVANEIRREQTACLELQDPIQRRKCLQKVEKMRRTWVEKSAKLKSEIYGR